MTDVPAQTDDDHGKADDVQPAEDGGKLIPTAIDVLADIAREYLALQREQQAVTLRSWEVMDSSDQRQNETAIKRIEAEDEQDQRRHRLAIIAICLGIGAPLALLTMVLVTALFGSERQSQIALDVLRVVGIALGGGGIILLIGSAISRFIRR